jgi:hypothetical protein
MISRIYSVESRKENHEIIRAYAQQGVLIVPISAPCGCIISSQEGLNKPGVAAYDSNTEDRAPIPLIYMTAAGNNVASEVKALQRFVIGHPLVIL